MPPAAGAGAARQAPPLWRQLQLLARLIEGVGAGQSLTRLLEGAPPALRAGAQALSFEVLRHWGTAQALRGRLAPRRPAPLADALLCSALALLLPGCAQTYPAFTVVDQTVEAAKREPALRRQAAFINACLRRSGVTPTGCWPRWRPTRSRAGTTPPGGSSACRPITRSLGGPAGGQPGARVDGPAGQRGAATWPPMASSWRARHGRHAAGRRGPAAGVAAPGA
jgi:hypothetical protein